MGGINIDEIDTDGIDIGDVDVGGIILMKTC